MISGNSTGISLSQTAGSQSSYTIANNLIGTNAAGTAALGGQRDRARSAIAIENATVQNNVISAYNIGVRLQTSTPPTELQHDVFQGNMIGTDKTGQVALGNTSTGSRSRTARASRSAARVPGRET